MGGGSVHVILYIYIFSNACYYKHKQFDIQTSPLTYYSAAVLNAAMLCIKNDYFKAKMGQF